MRRRFKNINVFSEEPLLGNPVAVVLDSAGLDTADMLEFTRWTNLSEATFVLPPMHADADYKVRIFTLDREMPFAGHPTLGTAHAWLEAGGQPKKQGAIIQECGAGLISIQQTDGLLWFEAPPLIRDEPVQDSDLQRVLDALGLQSGDVVDSHWLDNGPGWLVVMLANAEAVLAVRPQRPGGRMDVGLVGFHEAGAEAAVEIRALFSDHRGDIREDPVTGSLNAAVAQWLFRTGRVSNPYMAAQGQSIGCKGRIHLREENNATWVGGRTTTIINGHADL
jgi:PhzF family phenazine biosynthesis protein